MAGMPQQPGQARKDSFLHPDWTAGIVRGITVEFLPMTMTVKLDSPLEQRLRLRCAAQGVSASQVIREALVQWLDRQPDTEPSAHALGADLFGRHAGPADLATGRKQALGQIWAERQAMRGG